MINTRERSFFLRILTLLLAVCLMPSLALGTGADVADVDLPEISRSSEPLLPLDFSAGAVPKADGFSESKDENGKKVRIYEDSTIKVVLSETRYYLTEKNDRTGTDIWMADIVISDASQLRTASFDDSFNFVNKNKRGYVVDLAPRMNAVVALNGDSWGAKEEKHNFGVVYRQGQLIEARLDEKGKYRMDLLIIDENGDFHGIYSAQAGDLDDPSVYEGKKVLDVFSFGPILVDKGIAVEDYQGVDRKKGGCWMDMLSTENAQRVALCQVGPLHYKIVVSANEHSNTGLTLRQFADYLVTLGVQFAYNLDGGGSSVLYYHGAGKVNLKNVKQGRRLWDIIYFASAEK